MTKTISLVLKKISKLPLATQDEIGFEILDRIAAWEELREKIAVGIRELDAGLGRPLNRKTLIAEFRKLHAKRKK